MQRDRGFTLIEAIIVISILGLLASVIAAAFVVVIRTSPASEARADDSRSLLGITNWLSQDVASTSESGFEGGDTDHNPGVDSAPTKCAASSVPSNSQGLLQLTWGNFVVNYRWLPSAQGEGAIYRYTCLVGQPASRLRVSADMRSAPLASTLALRPAPVAINLLPTQTGNVGNGGIEFFLYAFEATGAQRELLRLDASTRNIRTTLPPIPPGGGSGTGENRPPTAESIAIDADPGEDVVFASMPIDDPDHDELFIDFDETGIPNSWNPSASLATTWELSFSVDNNASGTYTFSYVVCDREAGDLERLCTPPTQIVVTIVDTDAPPTAPAFGVDVFAGDPVTDVLLPISDENLATVTIEFRGPAPNGWAPGATWKTVSGVDGWYMSFPTNVTDPGGISVVEYRVEDAAGQRNTSATSNQGWVEISVDVTPAPINNPPTAGELTLTATASSTVTINLPVTDENVSTLTYEFRSAPTGWSPSANGAGVMTIHTQFTNVGSYTFEYRVHDDMGQVNTSATNNQGWVRITVTVTNQAPTAGPASTNASKGVPVSVVLPASDPEGQALSVTFPSKPSGWPTPTVTQSGGIITATFTPPNNASGSNEYSYRVTDSAGQFAQSKITATVCTVSSINVSPSTVNVLPDGSLQSAVTVTIAANSACSGLVLAFKPQNGGSAPEEVEPFNSGTVVVIPQNKYTWSYQKRNVDMDIRQGVNGADEITGVLHTEKG
jgi:prepilin-type N-terminal cleavage/methylation domain-containing protein